jgi:two-component system, NarL family, nitrate/nitrite response regulator NarL
MMAEKIRLLLLDDHTLFRAMLKRLLDTETDFEVVAECSSTTEALEALTRNPVDLALVDYDLGKRETGFDFIRRARGAGYSSRIFLLTAGMTDADYVRALGLGVCGLFLKNSSPELLTEAIRRVMAGETFLDQRCIRALVDAVDHPAGPPPVNELSEREREVLKGVFSGARNKEIASELNISEASVKSALKQLFLKTGAHNRSQLVRVALEEYGHAWGLRP